MHILVVFAPFRGHTLSGETFNWASPDFFGGTIKKGPRGMFWTKVAQCGPPGTPQKSAFFQERGRKRMKELGEVTFMKEWMKALNDTKFLALTHLNNLVSFPRYDRLRKKKCWYKQICNSKSWLLLTGHFGPVFIRPSQWSITAVLWHCIAILFTRSLGPLRGPTSSF